MKSPSRGQLLQAIKGFVRVYPLGRPRFNKTTGGVYTPSESQRDLWHELSSFRAERFALPIIVDCTFYFREKGPYITSKQLGDIDNLVKAMFDGMVKTGIIEDDSYIVGGEYLKTTCTEDWYEVNIYGAADV